MDPVLADPAEHAAPLVRTVPVPDVPDLAFRSPSADPVSWIKDGHGLIGWGVHARLDLRGEDSMMQAAAWFDEVVAELQVKDDVRRPGSGPVLFASGAFDPDRSDSVFIVPAVVLGRDEFGSWLTYIGTPIDVPSPSSAPQPGHITYQDGNLAPGDWQEIVAEAVQRIRAGRLDKVVLARDLFATASGRVDPRFLVQHLAAAYPSCWTYSVDGLVGATPELLVRLSHGHLYSRVLAGTEWGEGAYARVQSQKNQDEHAYAAQSAAAALGKVTIRLDVPEEPRVLTLPNVVHLATEIRGDVAPDIGPLDVVSAMHPTAAVGGSPTDTALATITELEGMNRGRYAGPVGWMDGHGNGEFGIALRGGLIEDATRVRLYAGCGIVAESDPETELAETVSKFVVMRDALDSKNR